MAQTLRHRRARRALLLTFVAALAGCQTPGGHDAYVKSQPRTEPVRTITSFSNALQCMDGLLLAHGVRGYGITSVGIPDATGQISTGTRDMLITAISQMTTRSQAFRYVDWDYDNKELQVIYQIGRDADETGYERSYEHPDYYIRGAITQLDQRVTDEREGGAIAGEYKEYAADVAADRNKTSSVVSLDLNIGEVLSRHIVPGLTSNNSLAVVRTGDAIAGSLSMDKLGISYSVESADSEGMHYAVRTLVELGAIEVLGKLAHVPYWRCLQIESTNPQVHAELNDWWDDMDDEERLLFTQRALIGNGYLPEAPSGAFDAATKDAIARYQAEHGLVVTGRPGLELYASLLGSDRPLAAGPPKSYVAAAGPDPVADKVPTRNPVSVAIASERGKKPTYAPSEELRMAVRADQNAFLYCYYQDGKGQVARIFPNRFQPNSYIPAGDITEIPSRGAQFQIRFDKPQSQEEVACVASDREIGLHLPLALKTQDLAPLPVASLDELIGVFEEIDRSGLGIARLPIQVTN